MGPQAPAKAGFIKHHEQINELKAGVHKDLTCIECHNPHDRAINAKDNCAECHSEIAAGYAKNRHGLQGTRCVECHMPKASKSAISVARRRLKKRARSPLLPRILSLLNTLA
jgi:formate-dependent nitrite reductase cytochrome c552 subunit